MRVFINAWMALINLLMLLSKKLTKRLYVESNDVENGIAGNKDDTAYMFCVRT